MGALRKKLISFTVPQIRRLVPSASIKQLNRVAHRISPETVVLLDYPLKLRTRWGTPLDYNPYLYNIINEHRDRYRSCLETFVPLISCFTRIPARQRSGCSHQPFWINGWMPGLDGVALYGFLALNNPALYLEVGSGNSTKFARRAIADHKLRTKIISIDPHPRAEIDGICDEIIRKPLEDVELKLFDQLCNQDILYIDSSHRLFMNSDVMVFFMDIFPGLKSGVLVHLHDIELPYDYPEDRIDWYYSEQYVLAAYLLARGNTFDIILPNAFISRDEELNGIMAPLWEKHEMKDVETHGCSFWLRIN